MTAYWMSLYATMWILAIPTEMGWTEYGLMDIFSGMSKELYLNHGDMIFTGQDLDFYEGGIGDFNNDGFLDVVNDENLYSNDGNANNWIKVTLEAIESNKNGIGARRCAKYIPGKGLPT